MILESSENLFGLPLPIVEYLSQWVIFAGAFFEAMPFGFAVPGHAIIVAGGFFAKLGVFGLASVIMAAVAGTVMGDLASFLIGRHYGYSFLTRFGRYFFFKEEYFCRTRALVNEHAGKTIILGRFNFMTRSFAPFIAGASGVGFLKFLFYSLAGGFIWAGSSVMLGYIFGQSFLVVVRLIGVYIALAAALSLFVILALRKINKKEYVFTRTHLPLLTANIASLYLFALLVNQVVKREFLVRLDHYIAAAVSGLWGQKLNAAVYFITDLFSPYRLALIAGLIVIALLWRRYYSAALALILGIGGGYWLQHFLKLVVARPRPTGGIGSPDDFSFPSGHATVAAVFFSFLIYYFKDHFKKRPVRIIFTAICALAALLTGFSRIYLRVHWTTDVFAGFFLGVFWLTSLILIITFISHFFRRLRKPNISPEIFSHPDAVCQNRPKRPKTKVSAEVKRTAGPAPSKRREE